MVRVAWVDLDAFIFLEPRVDGIPGDCHVAISVLDRLGFDMHVGNWEGVVGQVAALVYE